MASSAFPFAFPAQWVEGAGKGWYIDGGVHLNSPLKPAIDLGADRLLIIGATPLDIRQPPEQSRPPNVLDGSAQILHALLVDSFRTDLSSLKRINSYLSAEGAPASPSASSLAPTGHRVVRHCTLSPPDDGLSDVAAQVWPSGVVAFFRSLGGYAALGPLTAQRQRPGQFLSYLCFSPAFIGAAIRSGISDAQELVQRSGAIPWS
jgi:NTE family protein